MRVWLVGLALGVAAATRLAAQTNAERILNDQYSRSHDYDLVHQRIELSGFDWPGRAFDGRVEVTLRALRAQFDSVVLDAGRLLAVQEVRTSSGAALRSQAQGDTLVVYLARPVGFGDTVRFSVRYHGRVENGQGLSFLEADSLPTPRPRQLWSQGEAQNNHLWFPTYDFPNDRATWELLATVPQGFTVVSNGRLVKDRKQRDGTHTVHWSQEQPASTYLVSLVVAPLVRLSQRWRQVPLEYYVYPADTGRARVTFGSTADIMEVFSSLTGIPYPWPKYAQTTVADFFGGQENVSATTLVDWLPDARAMVDRPWYTWEVVPHELAHHWFGDYVTTANWANMWLNEGFGEFMPGQYWRERLGRLAEEDYYLTDYQQYLAADRDRRMPLAALGSNVIYPKGALVLVMLKKYLGEQRFWAAAHRFLVDHALGTAVTDDFRQAILSATGENLAWFFDQWLYQAGHPDFEVRATYDSAAAAVRLIVRQTQADTTPADSTGLRYTTPRVFRMPVLVRVGTERGDRTARAWLESGEDTVIVPGVDTPPTMVVFDDGNTILKRLSFPQPTAWLTVQLERDPDLWNRSWVLGQLAGRRNDGSALGALAQAAIAADYPLIRAQALEALAGFRADSLARSVAAWALADTAAAVRAAAFDLLAEAAGDPELARRAFEQDSSDEVRAAALAAMVELDSSSAPAVLRRALFTPSYRGVIGNTALALLARHGDTTQVGLIDSVLPRLPQAAFALVRLVNQGSTPALEALAAHLADPQPAIRRSVLRAFEVVVPRDLAVVRLRGALQGLTSEDARREITQVLERWEKR